MDEEYPRPPFRKDLVAHRRALTHKSNIVTELNLAFLIFLDPLFFSPRYLARAFAPPTTS
jgi:hypothetical protein